MGWAPRSGPSLALAAMAITMACGSASTAPTTTTGSATADVTSATCASPVITNDPNLSTPPRCVVFAGRPWLVKAKAKAGATSNAWSDLPENVSVDGAGLHLAITRRAGTWYSAEVTLNESLGHGTYSFRTASRLDQLDPNAVLGLFTYDYLDAAASYRELDIEYSARLGSVAGANGHFGVQPTTRPGSSRDFVFTGPETDLWHTIDWRAGSVTFYSGTERFTVSGSAVPSPGRENVRINLWLYNGVAPVSGVGPSVTITDFRFAK